MRSSEGVVSSASRATVYRERRSPDRQAWRSLPSRSEDGRSDKKMLKIFCEINALGVSLAYAVSKSATKYQLSFFRSQKGSTARRSRGRKAFLPWYWSKGFFSLCKCTSYGPARNFVWTPRCRCSTRFVLSYQGLSFPLTQSLSQREKRAISLKCNFLQFRNSAPKNATICR